ncbi:Aflatoxin biosynthesis regulatory protein [Penicillium digitatum]|nr:Aflatoxin biosynthesis regulatory protein [Penicillium digitatum]
MPPRRAHTKSRQGCDQCKRRRVKCDEKGPPCSNCISRELSCTYFRAPSRPDSRHDFLMNGILALGALHIAATIESPASLVYIDTALQYHNLTFAPYRAAVDSINPLNCEAALAQSIITTVIGIALPRVTAARGESSSLTENIVVVFELLQGVKKIHRIGESWSKLELFSRRRNFWDTGSVSLDSDTRDALERLDALNDRTIASIGPDQHQVNKDAIVYLRHFSNKVANFVDAANVLAWLAMIDKEFVDNVRRRQPLALLILMHWGVLLGELDGQHWWARDSGRALVTELLDALHPGDMEWANAVAWPQKKMGL